MIDIHKLVDILHLEDLRNAAHPSAFDENKEYDMLIIRLPVINKELEVNSIGFIITRDYSYLYNRDEDRFEELSSRFEAPYEILDKTVDQLLKSFEDYHDLIVEMEEILYPNKTKDSFMKQWLRLKHNIVRIERVLMNASFTMSRAIDYYENSSDFPINHYTDLHEHIERTLRSATLQLSKLDNIYKFYSAQTNEKLNHSIYILTIISAVFLPLNLLVGFFGINTSGLPFADGTSGTTSVVILMLCVLIVTIVLINFVRKKV
ncbi:MAG: CorA family divalent cation transporter [Sulfurimonas sp.]|uniref:magnesium transporter CorA family protein n=1 Tax=Sulfurimonas sp. TaxID=2022749 RepID=UPI002629C3E9|nr:CorA family divalent cation transporter [Sulfurimonas sp.]MDD5371880.1 CorA family divalent cation transporter [Sulfurimonas sp.]